MAALATIGMIALCPLGIGVCLLFKAKRVNDNVNEIYGLAKEFATNPQVPKDGYEKTVESMMILRSW